MSSVPLQLSQDELLLALALLGLPLPAALGPRPAPDTSGPQLQLALVRGFGALAARGLLRIAGAGERPIVEERLAGLARTVSLAQSSLVVAERRGDRWSATYLSAHDGALALHSSPAPGTHRLDRLPDTTAAVAWLMARAGAPTCVARLPNLHAPATVLATALDAIDSGDTARSRATLTAVGAAALDAEAFVVALGPAPARLAIGLVCGIHGPKPAARGALVVSGPGGCWWSATAAGEADLTLQPMARAELQREARTLVATLVASH